MEIYYASTRSGGQGSFDLWVIRNVNGNWQAPENLADINTQYDENQPYLTPDGQELYYTLGQGGAPEVWRSIRNGSHWGKPERILSSFAGEPAMDSAGNLYFVHHYYDSLKNKILEADIYICMKK
jgi:Tol biopolymer transport system component